MKPKSAPSPVTKLKPKSVSTAPSNDESTFHGVRLNTGSPNLPNTGVLSVLDLDRLSIIEGFNPREELGDLTSLAESIKSDGLLCAIVVRPATEVGTFEVIAGERRYRACKQAGLLRAPCLIRPDLVGDDDRALALALAENGEDGRTKLNMIEIGWACKKLEKKGWKPGRISRETGMHTERVRRALALIETPDEVQKNIANGKWSVAAALEYTRLDEETRKAVKAKLSHETTADEIRKYRKQAERAMTAERVEKGLPVSVTKLGAPRGRSSVSAWRSPSEKQAALQELCAALQAVEKEAPGSIEHHELRGCVGMALWSRGDRESHLTPPLEPDVNEPNYDAQMKDNLGISAIVKMEAEKWHRDERARREANDTL